MTLGVQTMSRLRHIARRMKRPARRIFPTGYFVVLYRVASRQIASKKGERDRLLREFVSRYEGKPCIQISVKEAMGRKFGPNWVSVDKYDERDFIDCHDDIQDLRFPDATFDAAVCVDVLNHVPRPDKAISELHRVLKPGGEIWVQLPFLFPYAPHPVDLWRVSPDGLRIWMKDFDETVCACNYFPGTRLVAMTYFCGTKSD